MGHAAIYLPLPNTRLLIVGYQGDGPLGRELMEGAKTVQIDEKTVHVKAEIHNTQAMSSHADQGQLMTWLGHIKNVKHVCLTHGDDGPRAALAKLITEKLDIGDVKIPKLQQEITV